MVRLLRPSIGLVVLVCINLLFFWFCSSSLTWQKSKDYDIKHKAIAKAIEAQSVIGSQLIGEEYTPLTTTLGSHEAKTLSKHPDFAAVAVDMLHQAGIKSGEYVAVNMSSSFPALNIAVLAAIDALQAKPVIISSVGASTWGANRPDYTWLDMEQKLVDNDIWKFRSCAVSVGGGSDMGHGLSEEGLQMALDAIARSKIMPIFSDALTDAIQQRIDIFKSYNNGSLPKVLINVGGNHVIFGEKGHQNFLKQGLTQGYRPSAAMDDGLGAEFIKANRSVIHFINIQRLAAQYGVRTGSTPGTSQVFFEKSISDIIRIIIIIWCIGMILVLREGYRRKWWQL